MLGLKIVYDYDVWFIILIKNKKKSTLLFLTPLIIIIFSNYMLDMYFCNPYYNTFLKI